MWFDSAGDAWIAEWNAWQLGRYEPDTGEWSEWALSGADSRAYVVYVDEADRVWLTDFGSHSICCSSRRRRSSRSSRCRRHPPTFGSFSDGRASYGERNRRRTAWW